MDKIEAVKACELINYDTALEYCDNDELLLDILSMTAGTLTDLRAEIVKGHEALASDKSEDTFKNYRIAAHSVKSTSKLIGMMKLAELGLKSEEAARACDADTLNTEYEGLLAEIDRHVSALETIFD